MSRICPLCGGNVFDNWQFGLFRCRQCNLVEDEAVWRPAANEQLNAASFGDNYNPVRSFWVQMFEAMNNRRTISRLRRGVRYAGGGGRLLEIGVGSGSFLAYANSHGYIPLGCDLSAGICRYVEQNTGIAMHKGSIESLPDEQQFDVVVMNHILEHVSDPLAFLKAVRERLKPEGLLHLAVPNVAALESRLPGWNSYEPYHLHYFSPQTLRLAVEKAGFKIQFLTTHESFSGWFLAIFRTVLGKSHSSRSQLKQSENIKKSNLHIEHVYRLVMIICGVLTLPFRLLQEFIGRGDEIILQGRNGTDG